MSSKLSNWANGDAALVDYTDTYPFFDKNAKRDTIVYSLQDEFNYSPALSFVFGFSLLGEGRQGVLVRLNACILAINLLLNYYFISLWSYNGAAIATIICIIAKLVCLLILSGGIICWALLIRTVTWVMCIGGTMFFLVLWIKQTTLVGAIVIGAFYYIGMIILTRAIDISRFVNMARNR